MEGKAKLEKNCIREKLNNITKQQAVYDLKQKYWTIITLLPVKGAYIWGTGRLGEFAYKECKKNNIMIHGHIDNNENKIDICNNIFSFDILQKEDIVIIASFYYVDIMEQLESMGIKNYIYYEELALIGMCDVYYQAFQEIHEELEFNKMKYIYLYDVFADDLSREIYTNIINFRISLETSFTKKALELSLQRGVQYFDEIIVDKLDRDFVFFDVGGFDGQSTLDFIRNVAVYRKIYFFEPDKNIIERTKKRLQNESNIIFIQAGVGEKSGKVHYDALGGGAGNVSDEGEESINMVVLDDYIKDNKVYVKLDIEGYEMQALFGMKNAIIQYKPILAVSVYHKCGDMHKIVNTILSWNPNYKVYMRHYTYTYADTVCYFVNDDYVL